ncbi:hypothetical protein BC828DRAFT_399436 [Blastocladiella britannica]|nr:hypothetical protein BC828DRAFT_399436 [Blastocladiella britannica]
MLQSIDRRTADAPALTDHSAAILRTWITNIDAAWPQLFATTKRPATEKQHTEQLKGAVRFAFNLHRDIPVQLTRDGVIEYNHLSPRDLYRLTVHQFLVLLRDLGQPWLFRYMWANWLEPEKYTMWAFNRAAFRDDQADQHQLLPLYRTNNFAEAHFSILKRDVNPSKSLSMHALVSDLGVFLTKFRLKWYQTLLGIQQVQWIAKFRRAWAACSRRWREATSGRVGEGDDDPEHDQEADLSDGTGAGSQPRFVQDVGRVLDLWLPPVPAFRTPPVQASRVPCVQALRRHLARWEGFRLQSVRPYLLIEGVHPGWYEEPIDPAPFGSPFETAANDGVVGGDMDDMDSDDAPTGGGLSSDLPEFESTSANDALLQKTGDFVKQMRAYAAHIEQLAADMEANPGRRSEAEMDALAAHYRYPAADQALAIRRRQNRTGRALATLSHSSPLVRFNHSTQL